MTKMELAKTTDTPGNTSPVSILFAMFYEPGRAFSMLEAKRHIWMPLSLLVLASGILMVWYFSMVDFPWFIDQLLSTIKDVAQREQTKSVMNKSFLHVTSILGALFTYPVMFAVAALYFVLVGKTINKDISFETGLALSAWASVPGLLMLPLGGVAIVMASSGQLSFSELNALSLNQLFFHYDMSHPMTGLLDSISVISIWSAVLTVIGFQTWTKVRLSTAVTVVLIPYAVIYAIWLAFAMSKLA
jgi:hypothetical protein